MKKILIACEYSGIVRDAFLNAGYFAYSCDILPTESKIKGYHHQGNVLDILDCGWDLMIAHPPCTYLSYAGNKYYNVAGRKEKREGALLFFEKLLNANIKHICIENPMGVPVKKYTYSQIINPFNFGDFERKRILLWLKNLPPLIHTSHCIVKPTYVDKRTGKKRYFTEALSKGKDRSKFFKGIANEMVNQWGPII